LPEEEIIINLSEDDLQEIIVNLLENAKDSVVQAGARENGRKRKVKLIVERRDEEIIIAVEDDGIGIKSLDDKLFEPFVTSKVHGTGLGLSICRRICEENGGSITAKNRDEGGARFEVVLKIYRGEI